MAKHYPVEQRERAVKMVLDHLDEYQSMYAACQAIGPDQRPGVTSAEQQRITDLEREVRDLKEANEIVRRPRLSSLGICAPRGARCIERW